LPIGLYDNIKYKNKVAKLKKAIYGLKQAPRLWYNFLKNTLNKLGFITFPYDEGIFIRPQDSSIIICHVDDLLIINKSLDIIKEIYKKATLYIKLEWLGPVSTFLGNDISINYTNKTINIIQANYINKLLNMFIKEDNNNNENINSNNKNIYNIIKPSSLPGTPGIKLNKNNEQALQKDITLYQKYIGSLLYLALKTRPDITFAVCYCARFMANPNNNHFKELYKIFGYLINTPNLGLFYNCQGDNLLIKGYSDSDYANDLINRKSTSGYIYSLSTNIGYNNIISWNSQLQKTVTLSSCEAEYIALKESLKECIYLSNMFYYLNDNLKLNYQYIIPKVLVDNTSTIKLAENPEFHKRSKHIEIIYHFTREIINNKKAELIFTPTKYQLADFLTKNVPLPLLRDFLQLANIK
jgi:hypothetical protein